MKVLMFSFTGIIKRLTRDPSSLSIGICVTLYCRPLLFVFRVGEQSHLMLGRQVGEVGGEEEEEENDQTWGQKKTTND